MSALQLFNLVVGSPAEVGLVGIVLWRLWALERAVSSHSSRVVKLEERVFGKLKVVHQQHHGSSK